MALPDLPRFPLQGAGWRAGMDLNAIVKRIVRQALRGSKTVSVSHEDGGQRISIVGAGNGAQLPLGFAVRNTGAAISVAAGKVVSSTWGTISASNPRPGDWTTETNFTGGLLPSTAAAAWLKIEYTEADDDDEDNLGTEVIALTGAAGGKGGGGGGGGFSIGDTTTQEGVAAQTGAAGEDGGAGGAGGYVRLISDSSPVGGLGTGYGNDGGNGGMGGDGYAGTAVTFTQKRKVALVRRRWTVSGLSLHATKGTASETAAWVKLATIASGNVTQHVIGVVHAPVPTVAFIES